MERHIPHVLDVFTSSPGARRRARANIISKEKDEFQKNPGSDSAVSVGSSDEEDEEQRNISRYFDYLNEDELSGGGSSQRRKKKKKQGRDTSARDGSTTNNNGVVVKSGGAEEGGEGGNLASKNEKNKQAPVEGSGKKERSSRKGEYEKDIRHIERHLSMKKTIRKKIMRDLQQAFVEDPKDFQQDPKGLTEEKKNNIDINNLTFSKNRLSKSEHNFLDMLKEDQTKERKGLRALIDFRKDKPAQSSAEAEEKVEKKVEEGKNSSKESSATMALRPIEDTGKTARAAEKTATVTKTHDQIRDDDSGHGSPTRESAHGVPRRCRSRDDLLDGGTDPSKEGAAKKQSFWKRITGKGKTKR